MPDYKSFAQGIHVSHYQKVDWAKVAPHVDFVIAKSSESTNWKDPAFVGTVQACYDYDIPCLFFHYYDGKYYPSLQFNFHEDNWVPPERDLQLQNMIQAITNKRIYAGAVDIEEFGNWDVPNSWMSMGAKIFTGRVSDHLWKVRNEKPTLVYTRQSYINDYAPNMNTWVERYDQWVCQPRAYPETTLTWEELPSKIPADSIEVYPLGAAKPNSWKFWQWQIDRFILPGIYTTRGVPRTVCTEMFNGTVADLHKYLNFTPGQNTKPPVQIGEKFTVQFNINVRSGPSLKAPTVGALFAGSSVEILSMEETQETDGFTYIWGKHTGGWSAIKRYKVNKEYMKKG